jgi:cytosine/adenosine deaminase-related metal-dependent hydrolase
VDVTAMPITNAHTHLDLTGLARICPSRPSPFAAWLCRCLWYSRWQTREGVRASVERGIEELKACGTTHVCDVTTTWQSVEPLLAGGLQGTVYLERNRRRGLCGALRYPS